MSSNVGTPIAGWFIRENTIVTDDLGVPLFQETSICQRMSTIVGLSPVFGFPPPGAARRTPSRGVERWPRSAWSSRGGLSAPEAAGICGDGEAWNL